MISTIERFINDYNSECNLREKGYSSDYSVNRVVHYTVLYYLMYLTGINTMYKHLITLIDIAKEKGITVPTLIEDNAHSIETRDLSKYLSSKIITIIEGDIKR